jgi:hypothetical protein
MSLVDSDEFVGQHPRSNMAKAGRIPDRVRATASL